MLRIRLRRMGAIHAPFYRVVVSDSRKTPGGGRAIDTVGHFDPMKSPKVANIDLKKIDQWIAKGAVPSPTVADIIRKERAQASAAV